MKIFENFFAGFSYVLYKTIGQLFPSSGSKLFGGAIRSAFARGFVKNMGRHCNIDKHAMISRKLSIGDYSGIGMNSRIQGEVIIGKDVMMGPECWIYTRNHEFKDLDIPMRLQGYQESKPVIIGDDVWIGSRVTILPGVKIGNGTVVGAGSVVTKDTADFSIVCGNPAKEVKSRNRM